MALSLVDVDISGSQTLLCLGKSPFSSVHLYGHRKRTIQILQEPDLPNQCSILKVRLDTGADLRIVVQMNTTIHAINRGSL
jgi:hypothetical protein